MPRETFYQQSPLLVTCKNLSLLVEGDTIAAKFSDTQNHVCLVASAIGSEPLDAKFRAEKMPFVPTF